MTIPDDKAVLIVQGSSDTVVTPDNAWFLQSKIPHAKLILVPKADHAFTGLDELREELTLDWLIQTFPFTKEGQRP